MVLAAGVLTRLAGFGDISVLLLATAFATLGGLAGSLARPGVRVPLVLAGLVASTAGLALTVWHSVATVAPTAGSGAALVTLALATAAFGPAVAALWLALRR